MIAYIVRRLMVGVALLVVMSFVTFALFFAGADPAKFTCGKNCTPELIEQNRKALGYDKPWPAQWGDFMKGLVAGREYPNDEALRKAAPQNVVECSAPCLGYSPLQTATVWDSIKPKIPVSASLAIAAFVMWITMGLLGGIIAALRKGTIIDRGLVGISLVFYAFPTFFIGLFLYIFLALKWQIVGVPSYAPLVDGFVPWVKGLFLPALTLALFYAAGYVRLTRAFVLESMGEDYIRTAKAKGLHPTRILLKHTMRAALTPIATIAGLDLAGLLGGAIITEQVFNYDGLGKLAVLSAAVYDLPVQLGLVLLLAGFVILANIIVDVLYAVIDPRVKLS